MIFKLFQMSAGSAQNNLQSQSHRSCVSPGNLLGAEKQGSCSISEQSPVGQDVVEGWEGALEGCWKLSPLYRG